MFDIDKPKDEIQLTVKRDRDDAKEKISQSKEKI